MSSSESHPFFLSKYAFYIFNVSFELNILFHRQIFSPLRNTAKKKKISYEILSPKAFKRIPYFFSTLNHQMLLQKSVTSNALIRLYRNKVGK